MKVGKEVGSCARDDVIQQQGKWNSSGGYCQHADPFSISYEVTHFSKSRLDWHASHHPQAATACKRILLVQPVAKQTVLYECVNVSVFEGVCVWVPG